MSADPELPLAHRTDAPDEGARPEPFERARPAPGLRQAVTRGSLWTLGGHGGGQVLRLVNNLIVTRLLFPEAFGVMAIVDSLLIGLQMVSDTGVGPALIHRRQVPDRALLSTAWTAQIVRGLVLWLLVAMLAPAVARFYDQPILAVVLPIAGLRAVLEGFQSIGVFVAARNLALPRLVLREFLSQGSGIAVMILWCWLDPSVWGLVAGGLVGSAVGLILSHTLFAQRGVTLAYDRDCAHELFRFGAWIFPSTILAFVVLRSDRLLLAKWLTLATLGVYNIAAFFSVTAKAIVGQIADRVFFPFFARLGGGAPHVLRAEIAHYRGRLFAVTFPALCVIVALGDLLIFALYDARYHEAGWMTQLLTGGAIVACANESALPLLLAFGDPFRRFVVLLWSAIAFVASIVVGGIVAGPTGVIAGVAFAPALAYPVVAWALSRHGAWTARLDAIAFAGAAAGIGLLIALRRHVGG